jgi:ribosome maturation factor RimP
VSRQVSQESPESPEFREVAFREEVRLRAEEILRSLGLVLCHAEVKRLRGRAVVTLYIDRESGVTLADCERASHAVEDELDAALALDVPYALEVASPGLDRPLWTLDDCRRFAGRRVTVRLNVRVDGASKMKGVLESVEGDTLTVLDEDQHRRYHVRFGDVKLARLVPEV